MHLQKVGTRIHRFASLGITLFFWANVAVHADEEAAADPRDAIWIEGETPSRSAMNRHPWWYDQVNSDLLSGGAWISNYSDKKEGTAEYDFTAIASDSYTLW